MTGADETAETRLEQARALFRAGRFEVGLEVTTAAVAAYPDVAELWNVHGVLLRQLGRPEAALTALERALALNPEFAGARTNAGNVAIDLAAEAERTEGAGAALRRLDAALALDPANLALLEAKAVVMRRAGDPEAAVAYLEEIVRRRPDLAWAHLHLGDLMAERNAALGEAHLRRALAFEPDSVAALVALAQNLGRTVGADEARNLDEAHGLARRALELGGLNPNQAKVVRDVFSRVCDFAAVERLGSFRDLGRRWAEAGLHTALFRHLPRVSGPADRLELLEQHRLCGLAMSTEAERRPIRHPAPHPAGKRIRLGLLSADLRRHPVGYFVESLFEHLDRARFEVFAYAIDTGPPDGLQAGFAARATAFRKVGERTARDIAQTIADDDLDVLIELGGSTHMNRLEVLAWRPAPLQVSWLGYPHSAGLPEVDALVADPWNTPPDRRLLLERPLVMPKTWIALGPTSFSDEPAIDSEPPEARHGVLTFGTANNPYKYTPQALAAWAGITASVPGARFAFVRPEGASAVFRDNILAAFAAEGVPPERVVFHAVRGAHLALYNEIDISLDTFPLTGGTTTVEALWMGVPVVSLRGEAFYERLSASILINAGLEDLIADDLQSYRGKALALAAAPARRAELRAALRGRLRSGPLGDTEGFARDFYDLIERAVRERAA